MKKKHKNPVPTVDIIIEIEDNSESNRKIVLIRRKNPPYGWALPGGFVDYGETIEDAAIREAYEETGLKVNLVRQFHTYSDPLRDPRNHTITTVFIAKAKGIPVGTDDAKEAKIFNINELPPDMAFDHANIISDYKNGVF